MSQQTEGGERVERDAEEGGQPGIPEGWVWQSYELPAPNGDGVILLDGWGPPPEAQAADGTDSSEGAP
jgi:hypothetical protein